MRERRELRVLVLAENALTAPSEIGALTGLVEPRTQRRGLREPPGSLGRLTALRELWLRGNRLPEVPEWVGREPPDPERLDLRWNGAAVAPGPAREPARRGCVVLR